MTDLAVFATSNAASAGKRVNWPDRRTMITERFPEATPPDFEAIIDSHDVHGPSELTALERMLRDILKFAQSEPGRDGPRPNLDWDKGMASYRQITGQDFTGLPFAAAFREITRDRTTGRPHALNLIARKTGISRSRVHRLLTGQDEPEPADFVAIAGAYGKKPQFFAEYRAHEVARHVTVLLIKNPEYSASVYSKIAGRNT